MTKRLALFLVVAGLLAGVAVSAAAGRWSLIYSDSDYLNGSGDYWDYTMTLQTGQKYWFLLTDLPWDSDFDMRCWRDSDHDRHYDATGERVWYANDGFYGDDESYTWTPTASASSQSSTPYVLRVYSFDGRGWYSLHVYKWVS